MTKYIIAYDLGTGGNKASLYDLEGRCIKECFKSYETFYPRSGWHEQNPRKWWEAVVESTRQLLVESSIKANEVECLGISGQSLGVVPLDKDGNLLRNTTPIWSDSRAIPQTKKFQEEYTEIDWYRITGNGFPMPLYSAFKIMWYRDEEPEMFKRIDKVVGSKDYINYLLTGVAVTDYSYASGSGVYDLRGWKYSTDLINICNLPREIFPDIVPSTQVIGNLTATAAAELGLTTKVKVVSGGVDNSCMALGARAMKEGRVYNSLGSSSWIAVTSSQPLINDKAKPFVFAHVIPGMFTSAVSTFAAGSSFRWVRDNLCRDLIHQAQLKNVDVYELMTAEAKESPVGSRGLLFNPNMAGGTTMSPSINIRGAFLGMDLGHSRADMIRATMEGVALELRIALDILSNMVKLSDEMLVVGGGSRSQVWRQIFSDVYNMKVVKTNIDQQAAALGAAACAAVGTGLWPNFDIVDEVHKVEDVTLPIAANNKVYEKLIPIFIKSEQYLADLGDQIIALELKK